MLIKKKGFISLLMLSTLLSITTIAIIWWHNIDCKIKLVSEKEHFYQRMLYGKLIMQVIVKNNVLFFNNLLECNPNVFVLPFNGSIISEYNSIQFKGTVSKINILEKSCILKIIIFMKNNSTIIKAMLRMCNNNDLIIDYITINDFI